MRVHNTRKVEIRIRQYIHTTLLSGCVHWIDKRCSTPEHVISILFEICSVLCSHNAATTGESVYGRLCLLAHSAAELRYMLWRIRHSRAMLHACISIYYSAKQCSIIIRHTEERERSRGHKAQMNVSSHKICRLIINAHAHFPDTAAGWLAASLSVAACGQVSELIISEHKHFEWQSDATSRCDDAKKTSNQQRKEENSQNRETVMLVHFIFPLFPLNLLWCRV